MSYDDEGDVGPSLATAYLADNQRDQIPRPLLARRDRAVRLQEPTAVVFQRRELFRVELRCDDQGMEPVPHPPGVVAILVGIPKYAVKDQDQRTILEIRGLVCENLQGIA